MKNQQLGFTMIELMITLVIIGILAVVALPVYQDFVIKTQTATALQEITPAKEPAEARISHGESISTVVTDAGFVGVVDQTNMCAFEVSLDPSGSASLTCKLGGGKSNVHRLIKDDIIAWDRGIDGKWTCSTTLKVDKAKYAPGTCQ